MAKIDRHAVEAAAQPDAGAKLVTIKLSPEETAAVKSFLALEADELRQSTIERAREIHRLATTAGACLTTLADHLAATNAVGEMGKLADAVGIIRGLPSVAEARGVVKMVGPTAAAPRADTPPANA